LAAVVDESLDRQWRDLLWRLGRPHFLGEVDSDLVVSITITGDAWCRATDKTYRVDTPAARDFLDAFVTLP
jgi:hypothetical protein